MSSEFENILRKAALNLKLKPVAEYMQSDVANKLKLKVTWVTLEVFSLMLNKWKQEEPDLESLDLLLKTLEYVVIHAEDKNIWKQFNRELMELSSAILSVIQDTELFGLFLMRLLHVVCVVCQKVPELWRSLAVKVLSHLASGCLNVWHFYFSLRLCSKAITTVEDPVGYDFGLRHLELIRNISNLVIVYGDLNCQKEIIHFVNMHIENFVNSETCPVDGFFDGTPETINLFLQLDFNGSLECCLRDLANHINTTLGPSRKVWSIVCNQLLLGGQFLEPTTKDMGLWLDANVDTARLYISSANFQSGSLEPETVVVTLVDLADVSCVTCELGSTLQGDAYRIMMTVNGLTTRINGAETDQIECTALLDVNNEEVILGMANWLTAPRNDPKFESPVKENNLMEDSWSECMPVAWKCKKQTDRWASHLLVIPTQDSSVTSTVLQDGQKMSLSDQRVPSSGQLKVTVKPAALGKNKKATNVEGVVPLVPNGTHRSPPKSSFVTSSLQPQAPPVLVSPDEVVTEPAPLDALLLAVPEPVRKSLRLKDAIGALTSTPVDPEPIGITRKIVVAEIHQEPVFENDVGVPSVGPPEIPEQKAEQEPTKKEQTTKESTKKEPTKKRASKEGSGRTAKRRIFSEVTSTPQLLFSSNSSLQEGSFVVQTSESNDATASCAKKRGEVRSRWSDKIEMEKECVKREIEEERRRASLLDPDGYSFKRWKSASTTRRGSFWLQKFEEVNCLDPSVAESVYKFEPGVETGRKRKSSAGKQQSRAKKSKLTEQEPAVVGGEDKADPNTEDPSVGTMRTTTPRQSSGKKSKREPTIEASALEKEGKTSGRKKSAKRNNAGREVEAVEAGDTKIEPKRSPTRRPSSTKKSKREPVEQVQMESTVAEDETNGGKKEAKTVEASPLEKEGKTRGRKKSAKRNNAGREVEAVVAGDAKVGPKRSPTRRPSSTKKSKREQVESTMAEDESKGGKKEAKKPCRDVEAAETIPRRRSNRIVPVTSCYKESSSDAEDELWEDTMMEVALRESLELREGASQDVKCSPPNTLATDPDWLTNAEVVRRSYRDESPKWLYENLILGNRSSSLPGVVVKDLTLDSVVDTSLPILKMTETEKGLFIIQTNDASVLDEQVLDVIHGAEEEIPREACESQSDSQHDVASNQLDMVETVPDFEIVQMDISPFGKLDENMFESLEYKFSASGETENKEQSQVERMSPRIGEYDSQEHVASGCEESIEISPPPRAAPRKKKTKKNPWDVQRKNEAVAVGRKKRTARLSCLVKAVKKAHRSFRRTTNAIRYRQHQERIAISKLNKSLRRIVVKAAELKYTTRKLKLSLRQSLAMFVSEIREFNKALKLGKPQRKTAKAKKMKNFYD